jgi:hypothetical protein
VALCLAFDWPDASRALLSTRSFPGLGRHALWVSGSTVVATPMRACGIALALLLAYRLRHRRDAATISAGVAITALLRLPFEPVLFPYYLAAPVVFVIASDLIARRSWYRSAAAGGGAALLFMVDVGTGGLARIAWWAAFGAALCVLAERPIRLVLGGHPSRSPVAVRTRAGLLRTTA